MDKESQLRERIELPNGRIILELSRFDPKTSFLAVEIKLVKAKNSRMVKFKDFLGSELLPLQSSTQLLEFAVIMDC